MTLKSVEHARFGRVEYDPDEVLSFPGLPGFPEARRWVVRTHDQGSAFAWLIALDAVELALVAANPWHFFPDYAPEIPAIALASLGAGSLDEVEIVTVATVRGAEFSLNLAAPILVNREKRKALQVILASDTYPVQALVPAAESSGGDLSSKAAAESDALESNGVEAPGE